MTRGWVGLLALALSACASLEQKDFAALISSASPGQAATYLGLPLASGQIVVSDGAGPESLLFALMVEEFHPFVHAGVIVMEDGRPYVYHAAAEIMFRFGGPPTDAMRGRIGRVALDTHLRHFKTTAIYNPPPGADRAKIAAFAQYHYAKGTEFDPYFDSDNRDKFYCAEFVALALEAGGAPPVALTALQANPSLRGILDWLKIRAKRAIPAGALIDQARHVATLSLAFSPMQIQAYFEMKRELHRRFTPDQKLGNVFYWSSFLKLREEVEQFMKTGLDTYAGERSPSLLSIPETVQALAAEILGPMDTGLPRISEVRHTE